MDLKHQIEIGHVHLGEALVAQDAGVVDQDVDDAEFGAGPRHGRPGRDSLAMRPRSRSITSPTERAPLAPKKIVRLAAAALGSKLVSVIPGIVFASSTKGRFCESSRFESPTHAEHFRRLDGHNREHGARAGFAWLGAHAPF